MLSFKKESEKTSSDKDTVRILAANNEKIHDPLIISNFDSSYYVTDRYSMLVLFLGNSLNWLLKLLRYIFILVSTYPN